MAFVRWGHSSTYRVMQTHRQTVCPYVSLFIFLRQARMLHGETFFRTSQCYKYCLLKEGHFIGKTERKFSAVER